MRGGSQVESEPGTNPYWGGIWCPRPCEQSNPYIKRSKDFTVDDLKNTKYLWQASQTSIDGAKQISIQSLTGGMSRTYYLLPDYTFNDRFLLNYRSNKTRENPPLVDDMVAVIKLRYTDNDYIIINAKNEDDAEKLLTDEVQKSI